MQSSKTTNDLRPPNEVEVETNALPTSETPGLYVATRCTDIENAEQALIQIQQQRNASLLPIRTPPELLGTIFKLVQDDEIRGKLEAAGLDYRRSFPIRPDEFAYDWLAVTHVCHYWRQVAILYPGLWTSIRLDYLLEKGGRGEAEWYIANAGNMPLSAYVDVNAWPIPRTLHQISNMMSRIRELKLVETVNLDDDVNVLLKQSAPCLESLALHRQKLTGYFWLSRLPILFLNDHPRLSSLSLSGYERFGSNSFRTVKRLYFSNPCFPREESVRKFFDLLDGIPTLEELTLFWSYFPEDFDTTRRVRLSNLRKLSFVQIEPLIISELLDCLVLPHDLALLCDITGQPAQDISGIISRHHDRFHDACRMELEFHSLTCLNIVVSSATSVTRFTNCLLHFKMEVTDLFPTIRTVGSLQDVWIRLPEMYTVKAGNKYTPFDLVDLLQPLENLVLDFPLAMTEEVFCQCLKQPYRIGHIHIKLHAPPMKPFIDDSWKGVLGNIHLYTPDEAHLPPSSRSQLKSFKDAISEDEVCSSHVDFLPVEQFPMFTLPSIYISKGGEGWDWPRWKQDI